MSNSDNAIVKALFGDKDDEVIKAGTLAVTRGSGVIVAAAAAAAAVDWPFELTNSQRIQVGLTSAAIWAFIVAFDAVARGLATAAKTRGEAEVKAAALMLTRPTHAQVVALPKLLKVILPGEVAAEESGWQASLVRIGARDDEESAEFFVTKGDTKKWVAAKDLRVD